MRSVLSVHLAAAWYMTGVIWVVQVLLYPVMARAQTEFSECHRLHLARAAFVVGPPMIVEAATGAWLVWAAPTPLLGFAFALLAAIWISTYFVQVPLHDRLARGLDAEAAARLVRTNWFRTAAWTVRALLLSYLAASS